MNLANALTASRILLCIPLILAPPFSRLFYTIYLGAGATDVLDGFFARRHGTESALGAALDTIADLIFIAAMLYIIVTSLAVPVGILRWIALILMIKLLSACIGYAKYRALAILHTYASKVTGVLLFCFPLFYGVWGIAPAAAIICSAATLTALEEVWINITSKKFDPDIKHAFGRERG